MKELRDSVANFLLFFLVTLFLVCLQVSLWPKYLGGFPSPHFWIPALTYWCLYRPPKETLLMTYVISFLVAPLSSTPLGLFAFTNILLVIGVSTFKMRFYQSGSVYFALCVGLMTFALVPAKLIVTFALDPQNLRLNIHVFDWILKTLFTTLISLPMYSLFMFFDDYTQKQLPTETGRVLE